MEHVAQNTDNAERGVVLRKADASPTPLRIPLTDQTSNLARGGEYGGLFEYWRIIRRRWGTVLVVSVIGAIAGILTGLPQTPVYRNRTTVEIQVLNENLLNTREVNPTPASSDYYYPETDIQTQTRIIQSDSLLERVVVKLQLDSHPESLQQPGRLSAWRKALGLPEPAPVSSREQAVAMAAGNLKVKALPQSRILEITCDSTDPRLASDFANTLIKEFRELSMESRWESAQLTGQWLSRQLDELRINLEKSEDRLQSYARLTGLMFTGEKEKENVAEQRLRQLQTELSMAQADRIAKQSKYEMAKSSSPGSLPEVLDDTSLRDYQGKLTELRRHLAELSGPFTPAHPKVQRLQAQLSEVASALERERANIIKRIENEQDAAKRREELLAAESAIQARLVSEQAEKAIHYSILKREVDTSRQLYDSMLQKVKEYGIASAMRASNIRVVDPAKPSRWPYKPNLFQYAQLGLIAGLFLGVVLVVLRERADRSILAPGDAPFYLKLPELGVIPSAKTDPGLRAALKNPPVLHLNAALEPNQPGGNSKGNGGRSVELVTWQRKLSLLAESFRATLESILLYGQNGGSPRVLVITSSAPMDGKTTMVTNLGI